MLFSKGHNLNKNFTNKTKLKMYKIILNKKGKLLQRLVQEGINKYPESPKNDGKSIRSILIDVLVDDEHDDMEYRIYISSSSSKKDWRDNMISCGDEEYIGNEYGMVGGLYAEGIDTGDGEIYDTDENEHFFDSLFTQILATIDYSKVKLHKKCSFRVELSDDY